MEFPVRVVRLLDTLALFMERRADCFRRPRRLEYRNSTMFANTVHLQSPRILTIAMPLIGWSALFAKTDPSLRTVERGCLTAELVTAARVEPIGCPRSESRAICRP